MVTWTVIHLVLALAILLVYKTWQLDFVIALPQVPVEKLLCIVDIPKSIQMQKDDHDIDPHEDVLKLKNYGWKQASRIWCLYLSDKLINDLNFKQSIIDDCVFYWDGLVCIVYVDDAIVMAPMDK